MKPSYLKNMTNEEAAFFEALNRKPSSVDMEDILSVHGDTDFNAAFQKLITSQATESSGGPLFYGNTLHADSSTPKPAPDGVVMDDEFLVSLEKNRRNVSGRLRYAYLNDVDAMVRGMDLVVLARLRRIMDKIEQIYRDAGGNASRLRMAILNGRGNSPKNTVPFIDEEQVEYGNNYQQVRWGIGAGLPGITAADFIERISDSLKKLNGLFPRDTEAEAAFQLDKTVVDAFHILEDQFSPRPSSGDYVERTCVTADSPSALHGAAQSSPNGASDSSGEGTPANDPNKGFVDRAIDWVASNPCKTMLIAAALVGGGILIKRAFERTPAVNEVNGLPSARRRKSRKSRKRITSKELA